MATINRTAEASLCSALVEAYNYNHSCDKSMFSCFFTRKVVILDTSTQTYSTTFKNWFSSSYGKGIERVELGKSLEGRLSTLPEYLSEQKNDKLAAALTYFGQGRLGGIASGTISYGGPVPDTTEKALMQAFYNPNNHPHIQLKFTTDGLHIIRTTHIETCPNEGTRAHQHSCLLTYNEVREAMCAQQINSQDLAFARGMFMDTINTPTHLLQHEIHREQQIVQHLFNPLNDPNTTISFREDGVHIRKGDTETTMPYQKVRREINAEQQRIIRYLLPNQYGNDRVTFHQDRIEVSLYGGATRTYTYKEVAEGIQISEREAKEREDINHLLNPDKSTNVAITRHKDKLRVSTYDHKGEKLTSVATYSYKNVIECIRMGKAPDPISVQSFELPTTLEDDNEKKIVEFFNPTNDPRIRVSFEEQQNGSVYNLVIKVTGRNQLNSTLPSKEVYSWNQVYSMMIQESKIRKLFEKDTELYFSAEMTTREEYCRETGRGENITTHHHYVHVPRKDHTDRYEFSKLDFLIAQKDNIDHLFNPNESENIVVTYTPEAVVVRKYMDDALTSTATYSIESIQEKLASGEHPEPLKVHKSQIAVDRASFDSTRSTFDRGAPISMEDLDYEEFM